MNPESNSLPQTFLFVNKTSKSASLSHGKADEYFYIQSHVQCRVRKQKRRAKQRLRASASPSALSARLDRSSSLRDEPRNDNSSQLDTRITQGKASRPAPRSRREAAIGPSQETQAPILPPRLGSTIDPFDSAPVAIDERTYQLLQYPLSNFVVTTFAAEALGSLLEPAKRTPFRHKDAIIRKLQRCIQDSLVMYAALANSASCIRWAVGHQDRDRAPEFYMLRTIERLKQRLTWAPAADLWSITCMHDMSLSDLWSKDVEAATAHMEMIRYSLNRIGGFAVLDAYMVECLVLTDKYLALSQLRPPILPLSWDPGPMSSAQIAAIDQVTGLELQGIGRAFSRAPLSDVLQPRLRSILRDLIVCIKAAHCLDRVLITEHELFLLHQALMYRLLCLETTDVVSEGFRVGVIVWLLKITSALEAERAAKNLLPHLRQRLACIAGDEYILSLALWLATVGARVAEFTEERVWFVEKAASLGEAIGLAPEKDAYRLFLQQYLYLTCEEGLQFKRMVLVIRQIREDRRATCQACDRTSRHI